MFKREILSQTQDLSTETHWEKAATTRIGKYLTRIETEFISKAINEQKINFMLDVGAEAGRFSSVASNNNDATVVGIDIGLYALRRLKLKNKNAIVVLADARKLPFKLNTFDGILMVEVLDYIPQIEEVLKECYDVMKDEATFVLSFGNQSSLKAKLRGLRGKSYMHSYQKVSLCFTEMGFTVLSSMGYNWLPFGRMSQSRFVPLTAWIERIFVLRRIPSLSPWVILSASKSN